MRPAARRHLRRVGVGEEYPKGATARLGWPKGLNRYGTKYIAVMATY